MAGKTIPDLDLYQSSIPKESIVAISDPALVPPYSPTKAYKASVESLAATIFEGSLDDWKLKSLTINVGEPHTSA